MIRNIIDFIVGSIVAIPIFILLLIFLLLITNEVFIGLLGISIVIFLFIYLLFAIKELGNDIINNLKRKYTIK